ncbi:hypothetical protein ACH4UR_24850 [Streptomyces lydicus]|uniref:hypothetical protein n=1 Tax=Streptomyces lydicus TaxID=47763 RepID=UPI0034085C96
MTPKNSQSQSEPQDKSQQRGKTGGLPDGDESLAALARGALGTAGTPLAAPSAPPAPVSAAAAAPVPSPAVPSPTPPQPRAAAPTPPRAVSPEPEPVDEPTSPADERFTQVVVNVDVDVLERFKAYQFDERAKTKSEPSNTVVVFRAINDAVKNKKLGELSSGPEEESDDFLAIEAPGRRTSRERRKTDQLSWRPTFKDLDKIDKLWATHAFDNRSAFIEAVLGAYLPALKKGRRARR